MPFNYTFTSGGQYTIEDDGNPANNISVIKDVNGVVIQSFVHPADAINFSFAVSGVNVFLNLAESLGTANLNIGSLTNAADRPGFIFIAEARTTGDIVLAAGGSITEEGSVDAAPDLVADTLIMKAGQGIGKTSDALETLVAAVEAETNIAGINITNFRPVSVGGLTADVGGLRATSSGDVRLTNFGGIVVAENPSTGLLGSQSGDLHVTAVGYDSDISGNGLGNAFAAPNGSVSLAAGRDILLGNGNADVLGPITVAGGDGLALTAGRDVVMASSSDVHATGGDLLLIEAGRDIVMTQGSVVRADGTNIDLATGLGGKLSMNGFSEVTTTGNVSIAADRAVIDSNAAVEGGSVSIAPLTSGRDIDLGSAGDAAFALELSDGEMDRFLTSELVVGSFESGSLTLTSAFSRSSFTDLALRSGDDIIVRSTLAADSIAMAAANDVYVAAGITTAFLGIQIDTPDNDGVGGQLIVQAPVIATPFVITGNVDGDDIVSSAAEDVVNAGDGNDRVRGRNGADILNGEEGADTLIGDNGKDRLDGGAGADTMEGGADDDIYIVDDSADTVVEALNAGTDLVETSVTHSLDDHVDNLTLTGSEAVNGTGNALGNVLTGNGAANVLDGGAGVDQMAGGAGNDVYKVDDAGDTVSEAAGAGARDKVDSAVTFTLGANVERLALTGTDATSGTGNGLSNVIVGNGAANTLTGRGNNDVLKGGGGADQLFGGNGNDTLEGGAGADGFRFTNTPNGSTNRDAILDFTPSDDTIFLDRSIFTGIAGGTLAPGAFRAGTAAVDAGDRILYDSATGQIRYDPDGVGGAAAILFAKVDPGTALTNADFVGYT